MEYQSENINELATALAKAQGEMKFAIKDSENPHFKSKYADLSSVIEAVKAPLSNNNLSYMQPLVYKDGQSFIETILVHTSGQWIKACAPIHIPKDSKNAMQAFGASVSYMRRYLLSSLVGIAQDDDDGNSATEAKPEAPKPAKINEVQVQYFRDQLEFHGEPLFSMFMDKLRENRITRLEDIPANWNEGTKKLMLKMVQEIQGDIENE